jgi:protein-L-isoaspartate(D-aspartate) O-methyltransferase
MTDWPALAARLAAALANDGAFTDERWRRAFEQTPRHLFVPRFWALDQFNAPARLVDGADPDQRDEWLTAAYTDQFLATQYTDDETGRRVITSSASQPSLVAQMLGLLDIDSRHRVLEIGTGTGYNTALLCHRLGDANVTSVDIDAGLVAEASSRLARHGYQPVLMVGDGAAGVAGAAPYDRILSTCASPGIPPAWIDQLAPAGIIVAPFTFGGALAVLTKTELKTVSGRFATEQAWFMPLRPVDRPMPPGHLIDMPDEPSEDAIHHDTTEVDLAALTDPDFHLWLCLHVPHARLAHTFTDDGATHTGVIVYTPTSRATITLGADGRPGRVSQDARRLADTVTAAWHSWRRNGNPARTRIGVTAHTNGTQHAWLDSPDGDHRWPLPPIERKPSR